MGREVGAGLVPAQRRAPTRGTPTKDTIAEDAVEKLCPSMSEPDKMHNQRLLAFDFFRSSLPAMARFTDKDRRVIQWIGQELELNSAWKIFPVKDLWLCPLCGLETLKFSSAEKLPELIYTHFLEHCLPYQSGVRQTGFTLEALRTVAEQAQVGESLASYPNWRYLDSEQHWFCPYCVARTDVVSQRGVAELPSMASHVISHLAHCTHYDHGMGIEKNRDELLEAISQNETEQRLEWIRQRLEEAGPWTLYPLQDSWLCPLCQKEGVRFRNTVDLPRLVLSHLIEKCSSFQAGQTEPSASLPELRKRALQVLIRRSLEEQPVWQVFDQQGTWYCPYCVQGTEARLHENHRITPQTMREVASHLAGCLPFAAEPRSPTRTIEELQKAVAASDQVRALTELIKARIATEPLWRVGSSRGHWICPHCRKIQGSVDVSTEFVARETAPVGMARHLLDECSFYQPGKPPAVTVEELREEARQREGLPKPSAPAASGAKDSAMQQIHEELRSIQKELSGTKVLKAEMDLARRKQLQMLPVAPKVPGYDFAVFYQPLGAVSGDFYDFLRVNPGEMGILIGDVSGHGVDAGMIMTMARKTVALKAIGQSSPKAVLSETNAALYPDLSSGTRSFVSLLYAIVNFEGRFVRFARAGHEPLVLLNPSRGREALWLEPYGLPVGVTEEAIFEQKLEECTVPLASGDILLLYTDGFLESANASGKMFGKEGIQATVLERADRPAEEILKHLAQSLRSFAGAVPINDDLTAICVKIGWPEFASGQSEKGA